MGGLRAGLLRVGLRAGLLRVGLRAGLLRAGLLRVGLRAGLLRASLLGLQEGQHGALQPGQVRRTGRTDLVDLRFLLVFILLK